MDIQSKVVEILKKEEYTFTNLAEYLHKSEDELTKELNNNTLELRELETISKVLRVPLYSFFRNENTKFDYTQQPYYINNLWTGDDNSKTHTELAEEIALLKKIIALKEEQLAKLSQ